ncbi:hypothetical protein NARC_150057 [Candidatus Nitrosocosmicus arcticus]|uniref:Uncharacterized protein n=1 Tax=Candidatus Nitrosocosmicus arcticus TaxID=2035267 RepID=A0A557SS67_9ARCH|nr:hypothetical protein NARC_150057 [Candidatus Nitrosocosmicus arcticus]
MRQEVTGKNRDQNANIEAFHESIKNEDCIWQHDFYIFQETKPVTHKFLYGFN